MGGRYVKGATPRYGLMISSFGILVNLFHLYPSLFLHGLKVSLWCFSVLVNSYFQVFFNLKVILYVVKISQNMVTELL